MDFKFFSIYVAFSMVPPMSLESGNPIFYFFYNFKTLQPHHDRCCDLLRTLSYFNSGVQFKETGSVQLPTPRHFMILSCVSEQGEQTDCLMICCRCLQMWSHQIDVVH